MRGRSQRIVLALDLGYARLGYAVVGVQSRRVRLLTCGVISTPASWQMPLRLQYIYRRLCELITTYAPRESAVEQVFFARNRRTAMNVGQVWGVVLLALAVHGLSIAEYTPTQVKREVTGSGGAKKRQVGEAVQRWLRLPCIPRPDDAADAVAIALCHVSAQSAP